MKETTTKQLDNAKTAMEKAQKKVVRIQEALNTGKNPFYYDESSLKWANRDLEEAKARLAKWTAKGEAEDIKGESMRIPELEAFLANWKVQVTKYYGRLNEERRALQNISYELTAENLKKTTDYANRRAYSDEAIAKILANYEADDIRYRDLRAERYTNDIRYSVVNTWKRKHNKYDMEMIDKTDDEIEKILSREVEERREEFVDRIIEKTGKLDTVALRMGMDGSINGWAKGEKGTAKVETISAGGYNIQCYHYRVLVK